MSLAVFLGKENSYNCSTIIQKMLYIYFSSESIECTVIEIVSAKYTERHITTHGSFLYSVVFTCKGYLLISVVSGINTCCSSYRYKKVQSYVYLNMHWSLNCGTFLDLIKKKSEH